MFCIFCKSMAFCVMAFILLTGCAEHSRTIETVARTDSQCESVLWTDVQSADSSSGDESGTIESFGDAGSGGPSEARGSADCSSPDTVGDTDRGGQEKVEIYVDVCGAVNRPGVVRVPEEARVFEAIEKAGGLSADADGRYINQARKLSDGEQIYVPAKDETEGQSWQFQKGGAGDSGNADEAAPGNGYAAGSEGGSGENTAGVDAQGKVNINTADSATLQTLNGIGESRAEAIILYRETNGAFETIEDIMKVTGIKNALFNNIKNDITV